MFMYSQLYMKIKFLIAFNLLIHIFITQIIDFDELHSLIAVDHFTCCFECKITISSKDRNR